GHGNRQAAGLQERFENLRPAGLADHRWKLVEHRDRFGSVLLGPLPHPREVRLPDDAHTPVAGIDEVLHGEDRARRHAIDEARDKECASVIESRMKSQAMPERNTIGTIFGAPFVCMKMRTTIMALTAAMRIAATLLIGPRSTNATAVVVAVRTARVA